MITQLAVQPELMGLATSLVISSRAMYDSSLLSDRVKTDSFCLTEVEQLELLLPYVYAFI